MASDCTGIASAWTAHAEDLSIWAWGRLVNRADAWGGYVGEADRGKEYLRADGKVERLGRTLTRPGIRERGKVFLDPTHLERHFAATGPEDLVGLHSTSPANTSLWGALDIDMHGDDGNRPEVALTAALAWYAQMREQGFHPLLTTSNNSAGTGGYHLRALLAVPAPTREVFAFLKALVADHTAHGLTAPPETFPKQPSVAPPGQRGEFGNWLRLPGRHHSRSHWSEVWDGARWLDGGKAIDFILALTGDDPELVPDVPPPAARTQPRRPPACPADGLSNRIAGYLAKLPNLGEGQGRDDVAFSFACFLVRDLAVTDDVALGWLERWDGGNSPPKGEARLREIIVSAHTYGRAAYGCGLPPASPYKYHRPTRRPGHFVISFTFEVEP